MDYLKRKTVQIPSLGESFEIRQLSHKARAEMAESHKKEPDKLLFGAIAAKYCVIAWADMSVNEIAGALTADQLGEVYEAISEFSGIDSKNSESTTTDNSSSS